MLKVESLTVEVQGKEVLKDVNLSVEEEKVYVLMGPNASGKTSLIYTILGYPQYKIKKGRIIFAGKELNALPINERVKMGIGVVHQSPASIRGVKLGNLLKLCGCGDSKEPLERVGLSEEFLEREVNIGFSGGEKKRSELAQVFAQRPKFLILDELDSGVDLDSLRLLGTELENFIEETGCTALVITHYRHILPFIKPHKALVMCGGMIVAEGCPKEIFSKIEEEGYCEYMKLCPPTIKEKLNQR
jgi:Fe-S cluster assembly ATP-binding protein